MSPITDIRATHKNKNTDVKSVSGFKKAHSIDKRSAESRRIMEKYPDRIPVIVFGDERSTAPSIDRYKYLIPEDLTIGQFIYVIRKKIKLAPEQAIYLFVNDKLIPSSHEMQKIYEAEKDKDGFLYITYALENTFG